MRTREEEKIYSKVANCFYLKVLKLVNLTNRCREKSDIIISSPCKRKLQQDQGKITKTNKSQIKTKQKQPVKANKRKTKKHLSKKGINELMLRNKIDFPWL